MKPNRSFKSFLICFNYILGVIVLAFALALIFQKQGYRNVYGGYGEYDLTKCVPYSAQGEATANGITMLNHIFETNSTKISIANNGNQNVTVYLYDSINTICDNYIGIETIAPAKKKCFTMLTGARRYQIGIKTNSTGYKLLVSDN